MTIDLLFQKYLFICMEVLVWICMEGKKDTFLIKKSVQIASLLFKNKINVFRSELIQTLVNRENKKIS